MAPFSAGGRWVPAPGVAYGPPGRNGIPAPLPATPKPGQAAAGAPVQGFRGDSDSDWIPSPLTGPRLVRIGGATFTVPRSARVKRSGRAGTVWVRLTNGETFVLSELGALNLTPAERRAIPFELL